MMPKYSCNFDNFLSKILLIQIVLEGSGWRQNMENFTVTKFSPIFKSCDWYGKDAHFFRFFTHVFTEFSKLDIFKMSKNHFPKHFCILSFFLKYTIC